MHPFAHIHTYINTKQKKKEIGNRLSHTTKILQKCGILYMYEQRKIALKFQ